MILVDDPLLMTLLDNLIAHLFCHLPSALPCEDIQIHKVNFYA
jgi:hypothetical protein